jgi:SapC
MGQSQHLEVVVQHGLAGFKVIDEARFTKLPDATFMQWRRKGWLPLVYAHFFSIGAWSGLVDRMIVA